MLLAILVFSLLVLNARSFYVNYFCYGANLNPSVLATRTLTAPKDLEFERAVLKDHRLCFNVGAPGLGPQAASVVKEEGSEVHGLVYRLAPAQYALLLASEGVPLAYRARAVQVSTYSLNKRLRVQTLFAPNFSDSKEGRPSKRYLDLIVDGAREQGLSERYQELLGQVSAM
jgi:hypothetical protein